MSRTEKIGPPHFVWMLDHARRPTPHKMIELNFGVNGWRKPSMLKWFPITAAQYETATLDELIKLFPAPAVPEVEFA